MTVFERDRWTVCRRASQQEAARCWPTVSSTETGAKIELWTSKAIASELDRLLTSACQGIQKVLTNNKTSEYRRHIQATHSRASRFEVTCSGFIPEQEPSPSKTSLNTTYPLYLANRPASGKASLEVLDKYSGEIATRVALADAATIDAAIAAAVAAEAPMRALPPYARQAVLEHCIARFRERFDELALALCIEAGKPIRDAEGEVTRLIDTFKVAAEEAVRVNGEVLNLEISKRAEGYRGFVQRVPLGACSFITPFNFPLNLVAHKVAPAIAAGCPFVLKPSEKTPVGALIIGEILAETDLPHGAFSILPCRVEDAGPFVADERLKLLSFTGGQVGWELKAKAGRKKVVLELGGNAACIVDADQRDRLDHVVERLVFGAYYQSGQSCIKVQRVFAHASLYAELRERFVAATKALKAGDPRSRDTFLGPLIDEASATRLERWIGEATAAGAKLLCGGGRERNRLEASVLEDVPPDARLNRLEAFGPVTVLAPFDDFDAALAAVNASDYGLQAGVFTNDLAHAMRAWDALEVGGVVINDIPSFRVDNMPYGGVKRSGLGREGVRYAIEDMTEPRLMVLRG
ncbi:MAG: aldehyde dehydrogenase family protein [Rhodanobacteraceae bacterium]|nr:aldehyde dehydrogenase family protein [Rhodanobacteraceae bacterium]